MMETLTQEKVKEILKELKGKIKEAIKDKFVALILYGSYARGDYEFGSDIDVLLVVRESLTSFEKDRISKISSDLNLKYDIVITCFYYLYEVFKTWETPLLMNVRREGIEV